jgi:hypothetical protein
MAYLVSNVHDPIALAAACEKRALPRPVESTVQIDGEEVFGWVVQIPGLSYPVVFNTLSGRISHHRLDGVRTRFAHLRDFLACYGRVRAQLLESV